MISCAVLTFISMAFAPWSPSYRNVTSLPDATIALVNSTAASELSEDMPSQTDLDSMYFSGKGLAKFAAIVYTANDLAQNPTLAAAGLLNLEAALGTFINNTQQTPLVYDTIWKGAVSSAGYSDINADFGSKFVMPVYFTITNRLKTPVTTITISTTATLSTPRQSLRTWIRHGCWKVLTRLGSTC
jgi:endoglucanase Acf2